MDERRPFLLASQELLSEILNERKAILLTDVNKETVQKALMELFGYWEDLRIEELDSREYEGVLKAQRKFLTLCLIYQSLADSDSELVEDTVPAEVQVDELKKTETEQSEPVVTDKIVIILNLFNRLCGLLEKGIIDESNMVKSITTARRIKTQLFLLTFILCILSPPQESGDFISKFENVTFSKEEIFASLNKTLPKPFQYNLYMKYFQPFLQNFIMNIKDSKLRNLIISGFECFTKQFPQYSLPFDERHKIVMKKLGMESFNLEDCCDRIDTRASVMSLEAPIEMAQKMRNIWLLLEASNFLVFDDNCMVIYVYSAELPVFHEQIMRIFYVINRLDESVREVGYASYCTPNFVSYYRTIYTEMHSWFVRLVRGLSRSYEIYELESDKVTGAIRRKPELTPFLLAKLKELCIYMTCPLASLDSTMRLCMEVTDIPILFGDDEERFIFTAPTQNILILHDFVASDRERFAQHTVELYPCLDRHFSRFHKSKKVDSQGPNLALPPSYHLFSKAAKPPEYEYYQTEHDPERNDIEAQLEGRFGVEDDCCTSFCKNILPGIFLLFLCVGIFIVTYILAFRN